MKHAVIATYVESEGQLSNAGRLVSSLRRFGESWRETPVWVFRPDNAEIDAPDLRSALESSGVRMLVSHTPVEARWFFCGGKPYAAAAAEKEAAGPRKESWAAGPRTSATSAATAFSSRCAGRM